MYMQKDMWTHFLVTLDKHNSLIFSSFVYVLFLFVPLNVQPEWDAAYPKSHSLTHLCTVYFILTLQMELKIVYIYRFFYTSSFLNSKMSFDNKKEVMWKNCRVKHEINKNIKFMQFSIIPHVLLLLKLSIVVLYIRIFHANIIIQAWHCNSLHQVN